MREIERRRGREGSTKNDFIFIVYYFFSSLVGFTYEFLCVCVNRVLSRLRQKSIVKRVLLFSFVSFFLLTDVPL